MNLGGVNYLWQKSEKTLHKNLYHVWKKVKAVKINVYFSGEKMLSCEKLNMKKNQEKTFWIMIELTEKNIFRKKSWRSGKKRYQGRNCFYHVWKKWKNVRGVHKSWEWKTVKTFQEENVFPRRKSLSCEKLNTKSFNICKQTNKKSRKNAVYHGETKQNFHWNLVFFLFLLLFD